MDYKITDTTLIAIANKLRNKAGLSGLITPLDMPTELDKMPSVVDYSNVVDQLVEETTTPAAIASFTDGANGLPVKELICTINPTETGTGAKSPSNPYVIGGHTGINVYQRATNLWDEQWELGQYDPTYGQKISSATQIRNKNPTPIVQNTSYCFYCGGARVSQIYWYDHEMNYIGKTSNASSSAFVTTSPVNAFFVNFQTPSAYGTTYNNDISINYPSTDTTYHAYNGQTHTASFGQTIYGGEFVASEGEYDKVTSGKAIITFTGDSSEGWYYRQASDSAAILLSDMKSAYNLQDGNCNILPLVNNLNTFGCLLGASNSVIYINKIADLGLADVGEFKTWLTTHNLTIVYPLATPTEITLPTKTQVNTLLGSNNLYHDCNGNTEVTYRANGALYVDEHSSSIRSLSLNRMIVEPVEEEEIIEEES